MDGRDTNPDRDERYDRAMLGVLFDGIAYGSLLFLVSLGLSVTMGLMNFVNLAHGAFAMTGGFVCVVPVRKGLSRWHRVVPSR